jgi:AraC family transcriptional regulator of adaptative response/methylated-DNA-[protein]-cysteine methyltransferase
MGLAGIAVGDQGVRVVVLGDDADELTAEVAARLGGDPAVQAAADDPDVAAVLAAVDGTGPLPKVDLRGTPFQLDVWAALQRIPIGSTVSYAELAAAAGHPNAVRAIGTACGANPVAVIVPCHRVLRADGTLGGYHWGTVRKAALLRREGAAAAG